MKTEKLPSELAYDMLEYELVKEKPRNILYFRDSRIQFGISVTVKCLQLNICKTIVGKTMRCY